METTWVVNPASRCEECDRPDASVFDGATYCDSCLARFQSQAETVNAGNTQADGFFD